MEILNGMGTEAVTDRFRAGGIARRGKGQEFRIVAIAVQPLVRRFRRGQLCGDRPSQRLQFGEIPGSIEKRGRGKRLEAFRTGDRAILMIRNSPFGADRAA